MIERLEWELALLLNGRADAAYVHDWGMVREYDRKIAEKQTQIKLAEAAVDQLTAQLFPGVRVAK